MPFRAAWLFYFDLKHRAGGGIGRQEPIFIGAGNYKGVFLPTGAYVWAPSLKGLKPSEAQTPLQDLRAKVGPWEKQATPWELQTSGSGLELEAGAAAGFGNSGTPWEKFSAGLWVQALLRGIKIEPASCFSPSGVSYKKRGWAPWEGSPRPCCTSLVTAAGPCPARWPHLFRKGTVEMHYEDEPSRLLLVWTVGTPCFQHSSWQLSLTPLHCSTDWGLSVFFYSFSIN